MSCDVTDDPAGRPGAVSVVSGAAVRVPAISILVPLHNEEPNVEKVFSGIEDAFRGSPHDFEVIFVNDGSTDGSEVILRRLQRDHDTIVVVNLFRRRGKAAAVELGISVAAGRSIVLMDCDLQYDPRDVIAMLRKLEEGYDLVSGCRIPRRDGWSTVTTSRMFNLLIRCMTGLRFKDYFSGLKCFKREVVEYLSLYGDLYRFVAVYAYKQGFRVVEVPVQHFERAYGRSKYNGLTRAGMAFVDLLTILMTVVLNRDRVYYLNILGLLSLGAGTTLLGWSVVRSVGYGAPRSTSLVLIGVTLAYAGVQTLILRWISREFFERHQNEIFRRRRNVRSVVGHARGRAAIEAPDERVGASVGARLQA